MLNTQRIDGSLLNSGWPVDSPQFPSWSYSRRGWLLCGVCQRARHLHVHTNQCVSQWQLRGGGVFSCFHGLCSQSASSFTWHPDHTESPLQPLSPVILSCWGMIYHTNVCTCLGVDFVFDIRRSLVLTCMHDETLELKHGLSSGDGKTLPVGGATAVWRASHRASLSSPLHCF